MITRYPFKSPERKVTIHKRCFGVLHKDIVSVVQYFTRGQPVIGTIGCIFLHLSFVNEQQLHCPETLHSSSFYLVQVA